MKIIKCVNKQNREFETLISDEDYEKVSKYHWGVDIGIQKSGREYYRVRRCYDGVKLHRFIMNVTDPKIEVDHINHNPLDNRRENLRLCSRRENLLNKEKCKKATSIFKGVVWSPRDQCWYARIVLINGKRKYLGVFTSEEDAAHMYDAYAKTLPDAEYRVLNFPNDLITIPIPTRNKRRDSSSKYYGVSKIRDKEKWITNNGKKRIGTFMTELEAAQAYDAYIKSLPNCNKPLNFPEENVLNYEI